MAKPHVAVLFIHQEGRPLSTSIDMDQIRKPYRPNENSKDVLTL